MWRDFSVWVPGQESKLLGLLPGTFHGDCIGVNDAGIVIGSAQISLKRGNDPISRNRPFIWSADLGLTAIPMSRFDDITPLKINGRGRVLLCGTVCDRPVAGGDAKSGPFVHETCFLLYDHEVLKELPSFPGASMTRYEALNDKGQFAGTVRLKLPGVAGGAETFGFLATPEAPATDGAK